MWLMSYLVPSNNSIQFPKPDSAFSLQNLQSSLKKTPWPGGVHWLVHEVLCHRQTGKTRGAGPSGPLEDWFNGSCNKKSDSRVEMLEGRLCLVVWWIGLSLVWLAWFVDLLPWPVGSSLCLFLCIWLDIVDQLEFVPMILPGLFSLDSAPYVHASDRKCWNASTFSFPTSIPL